MAHPTHFVSTDSVTSNHGALGWNATDESSAYDDSGVSSKAPIVSEEKIKASQDSSLGIDQSENEISTRSHLSILRIGPLTGLAALFLALLLLFASFAILMISDGQETDRWHEPWVPTVWLAIFTAMSNKLIAFAAVQGVVVSWWRKAARGATLGQLHADWSYGLHAWKALLAGRHFNLLALACLCATFVAIDGPLLQRASSIHLRVPQSPVNLSVSITPELPSYWTGGWTFNSIDFTYSEDSVGFHHVVEDLLQSRPISGVTGCPNSCSATVLAPALATYACKTEFTYRNFSTPLHNKTERIWEAAMNHELSLQAPQSRLVYGVYPYIADNSPPDIEWSVLMTMISDERVANTCTGSVNWTKCALVSAIGEYSIRIDNGVVSFADPSALSSPKIVSIANNTGITPEIIARKGLLNKGNYTRTTLSGIINVALQKWYTFNGIIPPESKTATAKIVEKRQTVLYNEAAPWWAMQQMSNFANWTDGVDCAPAWVDPRNQIMGWLNELMFRTGVYTAQAYSENELQEIGLDKGVTSNNTVLGHRTKATNFYQSNMSYFAGAAVAQLLSIVIILHLFYGWWSLGWRSGSVSFSPLEIAKAFDAPLLRNVPSNLNGAKIAKREGDHQVRYGIVDYSNHEDTEKSLSATETKMAFERTGNVASLTGPPMWKRFFWNVFSRN